MANKRQRCFVIMPFSKTTEQHTAAYWTSHFEDFLKPLIEENPELEAYRSKPLRVDILREIITHLVVSPVVVADLTDSNPNVYWELGIRQSFKHGTVTIAEAGPSLPFDISVKGTLFYHPGDHIQTKFSRDFKEAIEDCLVNPDKPDSHVLETVSGRGTLFEIFRRDEAMRRLNALLEECDTNSAVLQHVVDRAKANQEEPKNRGFATGRFRVPAAELLLTNRYIDEDQTFYKSVENYVSQLVAWCDQLNLWEYSPDGTEKWFLKREAEAKKFIERTKQQVRAARDKVSKQL
jgi:hypothetical protein